MALPTTACGVGGSRVPSGRGTPPRTYKRTTLERLRHHLLLLRAWANNFICGPGVEPRIQGP